MKVTMFIEWASHKNDIKFKKIFRNKIFIPSLDLSYIVLLGHGIGFSISEVALLLYPICNVTSFLVKFFVLFYSEVKNNGSYLKWPQIILRAMGKATSWTQSKSFYPVLYELIYIEVDLILLQTHLGNIIWFYLVRHVCR